MDLCTREETAQLLLDFHHLKTHKVHCLDLGIPLWLAVCFVIKFTTLFKTKFESNNLPPRHKKIHPLLNIKCFLILLTDFNNTSSLMKLN